MPLEDQLPLCLGSEDVNYQLICGYQGSATHQLSHFTNTALLPDLYSVVLLAHKRLLFRTTLLFRECKNKGKKRTVNPPKVNR